MIDKEKYLGDPCKSSSLPYWKEKRVIVPQNMEVIHKDSFEPTSKFKKVEYFFKLIHKLKTIPKRPRNIQKIDLSNDLEELVDMINKSYHHENIFVSKEDIDKWLSAEICKPFIGLKIVSDGKIIASGIACCDDEVKEGIIDWVQVLPEYRKQGFGKKIIDGLLYELSKIANFVIVSGSIGNKTNPEKIYKSCGFEGNDIWFVCYK